MSAAAIAEALRNVVDPDLGIDVVSLGLVYAIDEHHGVVNVAMTMTSPACPMAAAIVAAAREVVRATASSNDVTIALVFEPAWSAAMMDASAKRRLGLA